MATTIRDTNWLNLCQSTGLCHYPCDFFFSPRGQTVELNRDITVTNYIFQILEGGNNFCHFSQETILLWVFSVGVILGLRIHLTSNNRSRSRKLSWTVLSTAKYVYYKFTLEPVTLSLAMSLKVRPGSGHSFLVKIHALLYVILYWCSFAQCIHQPLEYSDIPIYLAYGYVGK